MKTWTFHLRPGVKFHNGKPFDAADVVFTFKRILDKDVGSVLRVNFGIVDSIEAVDPLTVKFNLSLPYADLPAAVAAYQAAIVSESMVDTLTTHPIGTGPFRFVEYRPGDQLVMERNPDYFLPGCADPRSRDHPHHSGIHHVPSRRSKAVRSTRFSTCRRSRSKSSPKVPWRMSTRFRPDGGRASSGTAR